MKVNDFNICPECLRYKTCVLTHDKSQVWSCSDFEQKSNLESIKTVDTPVILEKVIEKEECQPVLV